MEVAHGVAAAFAPPHAGTLQALGDDALAARLDRAGADLPAICKITRIIHFVFVVAEVLQLAAMGFQAVGVPAWGIAASRKRVADLYDDMKNPMEAAKWR